MDSSLRGGGSRSDWLMVNCVHLASTNDIFRLCWLSFFLFRWRNNTTGGFHRADTPRWPNGASLASVGCFFVSIALSLLSLMRFGFVVQRLRRHRKLLTRKRWQAAVEAHNSKFVSFSMPFRHSWSTLPSFTGFYWVSLRVLIGFTGFYWVSIGFTGFWLDLLGFTGFYWVLLGITGFWLVLLGFDWFYWVLLGFNGFQLVFNGFYWVSMGFTGFYWVSMGLTGFNWVSMGSTSIKTRWKRIPTR